MLSYAYIDSTQSNLYKSNILSLGIAIQNFPEGAIISMPLHAEGESKMKALFYGILSGAVEPVATCQGLFNQNHLFFHTIFSATPSALFLSACLVLFQLHFH